MQQLHPLLPYCCTGLNVKMVRDSSSSSGLDIENISVIDYTCELVIRRYLEKISTTKVDPHCIPFAELSKDILAP